MKRAFMHTPSYALSILCLLLAVGADLVEGQFLSRDYRRLWANELLKTTVHRAIATMT